MGDAARLEQVLVNLLVNASKYSHEGTGIRVGARADDEGVLLQVEDEGCGIHPEIREAVFQPFVRAHGSSGEGLGIGLTLARELVRLHEGRVTLDAGRGGRGTLVTVRLPVLRGKRAPAHTEEPTAHAPGVPLTVVVVDDHGDARAAMRLFLERDGHRVVSCATAAEALATTPGASPDLVLLDIDLPTARAGMSRSRCAATRRSRGRRSTRSPGTRRATTSRARGSRR
jgi:CheY-like chemotaxis protein/anti-sigma regulatory factor (Ser/Thr protein kinase)